MNCITSGVLFALEEKGVPWVSRYIDLFKFDQLISSAMEQNSVTAPTSHVRPLTDRQRQVLRLVSEGRSAKEVAVSLNISVKTAQFHKASIMEKLNLHSSGELVRFAVRNGLID